MSRQQEKLANEGGKPTIKEKLPGWPWFSQEIIEAAVKPLNPSLTAKRYFWAFDSL